MQIDITINIVDVYNMAAAEVARRFPGCELGGLRVLSWNHEILNIANGALETPVRHHLNEAHAALKDIPNAA